MYETFLQVVFHAVITLIVAIIASIVTAGYVSSCDALYQDVRLVFLQNIL